MYRYAHFYIEKAIASAADHWDPRNGCSDSCLFARLVADLDEFGLHVGGRRSPGVPLGMVPASLR